MLSLSIACLSASISAVSTLGIASQDSIATSSSNPLDLLSSSSQSISWPNISFPVARPPPLAANMSALKALGIDTDEPIYWESTPSGNTLGVQCHARYGRRLDYRDCRDAYSLIPRSNERLERFAERHSGLLHDVAMPLRFLGSMSSL